MRQVVHWLFVYLEVSIQNTVPRVCSLHSDIALHSVDCHTTTMNKTNWYFFMMVQLPQHWMLSSPRSGKWFHFRFSLSLGRSYLAVPNFDYILRPIRIGNAGIGKLFTFQKSNASLRLVSSSEKVASIRKLEWTNKCAVNNVLIFLWTAMRIGTYRMWILSVASFKHVCRIASNLYSVTE